MTKLLCFLLPIFLITSFCSATSWNVGPTQTYTLPSQVKNLVADGDTIFIDGGIYMNDATKWTNKNLVFIGLGTGSTRTVLRHTGNISNSKGIFVFETPGTNDNIYALNTKLPIKLDEHNIAEYVRFFFKYVRSAQGKFNVTESVDDINWREEPPPAASRAISDLLMPVTLKEKTDDGKFHLEMSVIFKTSLFKVSCEVNQEGFVDVLQEILLIEGLPVLDDVLKQ